MGVKGRGAPRVPADTGNLGSPEERVFVLLAEPPELLAALITGC